MIGLDKIKQKIENEGKSEADKIKKQGDTEIQALKQENKENILRLKNVSRRQIENEVKLFEDKTIAQARLNAKREYLSKREEIINEIIDDSTTVLSKNKKYRDFLLNLLKKHEKTFDGNVTVIANKHDSGIIKTHLPKHFSIKHVEIDGGLIFEDVEGKRLNETLSSIIDRKRNDMRKEIIKLVE